MIAPPELPGAAFLQAVAASLFRPSKSSSNKKAAYIAASIRR